MLRAYTDQPEVMPAELRRRIEEGWGGAPVMLYGLLDLDPQLGQTERWVALGPRQLALTNGEGAIQYVKRDHIHHVEEHPGLSATTLILVGEDTRQPALATLRYSYRQQNAVGAIAFVLKQALDGNTIRYEGDPDALYADAIAKPNRDAQATVVQNQSSVLRRLAGFAKPYWRNLALGLFGAIGLTAMMLIPPFLTRHIIDGVVMPATQGDITGEEALNQGLWLAGILLGTFIIREFFLWLRLNQLSILGEYIARDLRRTLYDHLHRLSVSFFSRHQTGSIISRVSSDTDRIWDFIAFGVAELLFGLTLMLGLAGVLLYLDWQLGLILVLPMPLLFLLLYWMGRKLHRVFLRIWQRWSEMTSTVSDTMPGIRVVQAFDQSDYERARFHQRNDKVFEEATRIHRIWTSHWPLIYLGVNILIVAVWFLGIPRMLGTEGFRPMSTGTFVAFLFYMGMFVMPLEMFGYLTRMINRSISSAQRVFEILDTEPEVREVENPMELRPLEGHIVFEDVTFGYDPVRQILKGVSFQIQPGEMIGLVGPSGAGKTTIINLIARFFDTTTGAIRIDGHNIRELDLGALRQQIGMVLQDPYLFHGSVLDNIRYGKPDASFNEVIAAARAANAHDFICKLPNGYDTIVGERGHTLSGGERQRVSIARAVLHNPRVLILDEATSSVDTETERKIQEAIDRLIHGRTVIAIAHRLSTLSRANRLFVMKDGKLVETGTHAELLENPDGVYTKLHRIQRELHEMYAV
ncbi:MAG: ATP-binding cassette subfamily B bacterial [Puniceicoccaceae bacterium 5H]|nr:MAG: ATP-binding cassette subfamily B bacterial [Puniceicoccaceae bacterium 5H]